MYDIMYNSYRSVAGFNSRVRFLIIGYTAVDFQGAVRSLAGSGRVSVHYLIPDPSDPSYKAHGFSETKLFSLVDEKDRAWHAGESHWAGRTNLNDSSIGISLVNLARDEGGHIVFPPFHDEQIQATKQLARNILQRYPTIEPANVLAHSDVAPGRKSDPGAAFPWKDLHDADVGAWYGEKAKRHYEQAFQKNGLPSKADVVDKLHRYGYDTQKAGTERGYMQLIRALQLHFRPTRYDGVLDVETAAILYALVERYRQEATQAATA